MADKLYSVTKTYGHHLGLSTTFRQWRATSHCRFLHGYALSVELEFMAPRLNNNNWVIDFGSLKPVKEWLMNTFDHKTLVAEDDPALPLFKQLAGWDDIKLGYRDPEHPEYFKHVNPLIDMIVVPAVGCEGFAIYIADKVNQILFGELARENLQGGADNGVFLNRVTVREHDSNAATYFPDICNKAHLNKDCEPETGNERRITRDDFYAREPGSTEYKRHLRDVDQRRQYGGFLG